MPSSPEVDRVRKRERRAADPAHRERVNQQQRDCYRRHAEARKAASRTRYRTDEGYRERTKQSARLRQTGVTPERYAALMVEQQGRCAICGRGDLVLCADHDHASGQSRSLLCSPCNLGLGKFEDDAERLESAARYIRSFEDGKGGFLSAISRHSGRSDTI